jgi:hypothetical protein
MNAQASQLRYATAAHAKMDPEFKLHGSKRPGSRAHDHSGHSEINVGELERQFSLIGGTVLAVCGLMRGSLSGLALATLGGALIWRGHTGHCEMYHALGHSCAEVHDHR